MLIFVGLPRLAIGALSIPLSMAMAAIQRREERRFRPLMEERGRFVEWDRIEPDLIAGRGTLVIEQGHKCPVRLWWTPEDPQELSPVPIPGSMDLDVLSFEPDPFVEWCHGRYLEADQGLALLTVVPSDLPPGLLFAEFFRDRYPGISAVDTLYWRPGKDA